MIEKERRFTVVVLVPPHATEYDTDTYVAHVHSDDAMQARKAGARQAWRSRSPLSRGKLSTWKPLVVFKGHLDVQAWGWQA